MARKASLELWRAHRHIAEACLEHPFVQGIATGELPLPCFKFYVGQDAFFLDSFSRAYALALAKSPDEPFMYACLELLEGALNELKLHRRYAEKWEIDLQPQPASTTRAYTDFLLRVAWSEPVDGIMAAMMPCMRLYAYLGQSLAPLLNPASPYREWVETYSSSEFDALASKLEELYDHYSGAENTAAKNFYRTAMELELAFFEQAYQYQEPPKR